MNTSRSYLLGTIAILAIAGMLGLAFSQGLIGATTSRAAAPLLEVGAQPTPATLGHSPLLQSGDRGDSDTTGTTPHTGTPAIRLSISNADPNVTQFTEKDVRDFASTFTSIGLGKISLESGEMQIESVQFVTMGTFRSRPSQPLAQDLKFSDGKLLCYVEYSGNFAVHGPGGRPPTYFKHAAQVYDAHTGNFLAQTAYDRK